MDVTCKAWECWRCWCRNII